MCCKVYCSKAKNRTAVICLGHIILSVIALYYFALEICTSAPFDVDITKGRDQNSENKEGSTIAFNITLKFFFTFVYSYRNTIELIKNLPKPIF